ncbi:hypothetical protein EN45_046250 [Penicillium chrysogenum]|jgi:hypothetical protein|uniref:F-box domain-containing protein n=1 Tax=Penicillium chrysogenum TaxID=5076 RepID=A0A167YR86_PENCH|nr:uncharacterized protein N7525_010082 [Penicillium rubens]KAJ5820798.1 hypothetical protein N7525_010082 [Penicillium rubens]KZN94428.1 hypothetical protein EN45_046250 [Penicillium chrysogenum]
MTRFLNRVRTVLRRGKRDSMSAVPRTSGWKRLPCDVFVTILAFCDLKDIGTLFLSCRALHDRVSKLDRAIAWAYVQLRKQHRQSHCNDGDMSPGDDIAFVSELFPPSPPEYSTGMAHDNAGYSLGYLGDLKRCWNTCIRLSYHLADHVVEHHLETDIIARPLWSSSKTEREVIYSKAVASLQAKLLHPMYGPIILFYLEAYLLEYRAYAVFFLESAASSGSDCGHPAHQYKNKAYSIERQQSILRNAPFDDTLVFLSTHHCMQLLFSTVQRLMGPEIPRSSAKSWLSILLTTSTMERIVDFFVSIAKDNQRKEKGEHESTWSHRKEFLWAMRKDLNEYMASFNGQGEHTLLVPELNHVWFQAARNEMDRRGAIPHTVKYSEVQVLHGSVVKLECGYCYDCYDE